MYAQVIGGVVIQYPFSLAQLTMIYPQVSFPTNPSDAFLVDYDVYPVAPVAAPPIDPITQSVAEVLPTFVVGVWTQTWQVTTLDLATQKVNSVTDINIGTHLRLLEFVRTRSYVDVLSAVSMVGDTNPQFDSDGIYVKDSRSTTWTQVIDITNEIDANTRPPCSFASIESLLPALVWPTPVPVIDPHIHI